MIFEREWQAGWMKDTQLYEQILGVQAPWKVESVELNQEAGEIEVRSGYAFPAPRTLTRTNPTTPMNTVRQESHLT